MNVDEIIQKSETVLKQEYPTIELKKEFRKFQQYYYVYLDGQEQDISMSYDLLNTLVHSMTEREVIKEISTAFLYELKR